MRRPFGSGEPTGRGAAHGQAQGAKSRGKIPLANVRRFWENSTTTSEFLPRQRISEARPCRVFVFLGRGPPSMKSPMNQGIDAVMVPESAQITKTEKTKTYIDTVLHS
jgi:hypothetical protein